MSAPKISVVMCAYNAEDYLQASVDSILSQTFGDFEFIIVDDGSSDQTPEILASYDKRDSRIVHLRNDKNLSVPGATNRGFAAARGEYIARMDADDIAAPTRLEKQYAFLETNPTCVVVGAGYQQIDARGRVEKTDNQSVSPSILRWRAIFKMPLVHSSMMFRRGAILENSICFDPTFDGAADFDFTQRLLRFGDPALIAEPLMQYRMHDQNVSTRKRELQHNAARRACVREARLMFPEFNRQRLEQLYDFIHADAPKTGRDISAAIKDLRGIQNKFADRHDLSREEALMQESFALRWIVMALLRRKLCFASPALFIEVVFGAKQVRALLAEIAHYTHSRFNRIARQHMAPSGTK